MTKITQKERGERLDFGLLIPSSQRRIIKVPKFSDWDKKFKNLERNVFVFSLLLRLGNPTF